MQIMTLHCSKSSNGFSKRQRPYKGPTKICSRSLLPLRFQSSLTSFLLLTNTQPLRPPCCFLNIPSMLHCCLFTLIYQLCFFSLLWVFIQMSPSQKDFSSPLQKTISFIALFFSLHLLSNISNVLLIFFCLLFLGPKGKIFSLFSLLMCVQCIEWCLANKK